jgi:hypothetical protein
MLGSDQHPQAMKHPIFKPPHIVILILEMLLSEPLHPLSLEIPSLHQGHIKTVNIVIDG